jgi:hypothetical protein
MSDDNVPCSLFRINNNMETTYVEYITSREMIGEKRIVVFCIVTAEAGQGI